MARLTRIPIAIPAVAAALAFVLIAGLAPPASPANAHGAYESSVPAENEIVAESPERVDVYFGQELRRSGGLPDVFIVNEAGDTVSTESALDDEDRTHVAVTLPPALPNGRYTVIWHTLSDQDGEEAQGAFHFYVGEGPTDGGQTAEPTATAETGDATPTPQATEPTSSGDDDSSGVPVWGLIVGIVAATVVAGGAGLVLGRSSGG
jgi:methionine-rich copper-binding protein CopC